MKASVRGARMRTPSRRAAAAQHGDEAGVVGERGQEPPAAGFEFRRRGRVRRVDARGHAVGRERIGAPVDLAGRSEEGRVDHAERAEQAMLQHLAELRALDRLDHAPEHVGREAIFPDLAGLVHERQRGDRLDIFGQRPVDVQDIGRLDQFLDRGHSGEAVCEPRSVAHQVLHGDRAPERLQGRACRRWRRRPSHSRKRGCISTPGR